MADAKPLTPGEVEAFVVRGFHRLREAFPRSLADECRRLMWQQLGLSADRPDEWTQPVVRLFSHTGSAFHDAAHTPPLEAAWDQLVGAGRWRAQEGLGGTTPVRFPVPGDPGDDGWHIDGSFDHDGEYWVNVNSKGRSLLMLFLFSDVDEDDAPTRIRVGSHLDVPAALAPAGERGMFFGDVSERLPNVHERGQALATGKAGDVYLCHPFLVHAADRNRGTRPRFVSQPGLFWQEPLDLARAPCPDSPVETAIRIGLGIL
jgi:Phytanoyl-CoA dioxygenase (PhyH)